MAAKAPSYLTLRNGIYYFQIRVPKQFIEHSSQTLIRRTTGTGSWREALSMARKWLVELMDNDFQKTLDEIDDDAERYAKLYRKGRIVAEKLKQIDSNDSLEVSELLDDITPDEQQAYEYYRDKNAAGNQHTQVIERSTEDTGSSVLLSELLDRYIAFNREHWDAKTLDKYKGQINLMIEMVGNIAANALTHDVLRDRYVSRITKLPAHMNNKRDIYFENGVRRSIDEVIEIAEVRGETRFLSHTIDIP